MNQFDARRAARDAVASHPARPATAILEDTANMRMIVFRIAPGQSVPPHRSTSSVQLVVLEGEGAISGESNGQEDARPCRAGDVVTFMPNELHGMRAHETEFLLLATIAPRPGAR